MNDADSLLVCSSPNELMVPTKGEVIALDSVADLLGPDEVELGAQ